MPNSPATRSIGPDLNDRSTCTRAWRSPPHVSGTDDAAARPETIDEADARAVGEAVAVLRMQDRHEHAAAPELLHRAGREIERIDAGHFVDDDHQQDVVGILDRSKALADLDAVEAAAAFELDLDLGDQLIGRRLADDVADDGEDVGVGRGVIAVHAHFTNDARRGLRGRGGPAQTTSARELGRSDARSFDLVSDGGFFVVQVIDAIGRVDRADGEHHLELHLDALRQPHVREGLAHLHGRLRVANRAPAMRPGKKSQSMSSKVYCRIW